MMDRHFSSRAGDIALILRAPEWFPLFVRRFREVAQKKRGLSQENLQFVLGNIADMTGGSFKLSGNTLPSTHLDLPAIIHAHSI